MTKFLVFKCKSVTFVIPTDSIKEMAFNQEGAIPLLEIFFNDGTSEIYAPESGIKTVASFFHRRARRLHPRLEGFIEEN